MYKIAIIPYYTYARNFEVGEDGGFSIFRKKRSDVLKERLDSFFALKNWDVEVIIDVNHGDLNYLKRQGVDLFLLSPLVSVYMDYTEFDSKSYIKLTDDEFKKGMIDRITTYVEEALLPSKNRQ